MDWARRRAPAHCIHLCENAAGSMTGVPRHGNTASRSVPLGDDEQCPDLSGKAEDQVLLAAGAVMSFPGHVSHDVPPLRSVASQGTNSAWLADGCRWRDNDRTSFGRDREERP
jgi:hypothetical protein